MYLHDGAILFAQILLIGSSCTPIEQGQHIAYYPQLNGRIEGFLIMFIPVQKDSRCGPGTMSSEDFEK